MSQADPSIMDHRNILPECTPKQKIALWELAEKWHHIEIDSRSPEMPEGYIVVILYWEGGSSTTTGMDPEGYCPL